MPVFVWQGKTRQGEDRSGEIEAESQDQVRALLRRQNITPSKVKAKPKEINLAIFGSGVKPEEIVIFTRQMSTMIDAGLPLVQSLQILERQAVNPIFRKTVREIRTNVEGGITFADALRKHPKIFDDLFVNMCEAGEAGGILDIILSRLAGYMEKAQKLKREVKGAMFYPAAIVAVSVLITTFLLVFVIPKFASVFTDMGQELPGLTQMVIDLSDLMKKYLPYGVPVLIVLGIAGKKYYDTEKGRRLFDSIILKLPVMGELVQKVSVAKFTRTLGTLLSSGVPIIEALNITARTSGNKIVEESVLGVIDNIKAGDTIAGPLSQKKVFPPMVVQMIEIGESTGALDGMLSKIADFYDEEVDAAVSALTSMLEPMIMVVLGAVIGGLVIAMFLPIFDIASLAG
jgi:type IV pilus assembly protein PilC